LRIKKLFSSFIEEEIFRDLEFILVQAFDDSFDGFVFANQVRSRFGADPVYLGAKVTPEENAHVDKLFERHLKA
jgi:hypothetical protein